MKARLEKIKSLTEADVPLFANDVRVDHTISTIKDAIAQSPESMTETEPIFCTAGRIMALNNFGKSTFIRFRDRTDQMQAYIRKDKVGEDAYRHFKLFDIGDFISIKGPVFKTKTGEWTVIAHEIRLLTKAIRSLPEKFHGLKDPEKRYRQRYLDLIMNTHVKTIFQIRSHMIQAIRQIFLDQDYLEVETPMMQVIPGGAEATPFITRHHALNIDLYLRIAPELYLKRLIIGGFERVFEINRNFRNEGISTHHNPEFTELEFYQAYATYEDLMNFTETLFEQVAQTVLGKTTLTYQDHEINLSPPWQRINLYDSLTQLAGMDPNILNDKEALLNFAIEKNVKVTKMNKKGKIIMKLFDALVQPQLIQPTFITGHPVEVSPLSRKNDANPEITDRFELFIAGLEVANGFSELNDPNDQRNRFIQQVAERDAGDEEAHQMDEDFVEALEYGMPPTAGEGIGIDRMVMLFTNSPSIREVIFFPHMKPVN